MKYRNKFQFDKYEGARKQREYDMGLNQNETQKKKHKNDKMCTEINNVFFCMVKN